MSTMLVNDAHIDGRKKREIDDLIGPAYGFFKSFQLGGTGSQRLIVNQSSSEITQLFELDALPNHCNIEIRPKGVAVHFRSRLDKYTWVVPFEGMILNTAGNQWRINDHTHFMELSGANNKHLDPGFLGRLQNLKAGSN